MNDQKAAVRVSAEKMKAAAEMVSKFTDKKKSAEKPKLAATGKKETVNVTKQKNTFMKRLTSRQPTGSLPNTLMGLPFLKSCNR